MEVGLAGRDGRRYGGDDDRHVSGAIISREDALAGQGQRPARVARRSFRSQCRRKYNANYFGYANPSYDKLIEEADTSHDRKARKDAVVKLQRFLSEDAV